MYSAPIGKFFQGQKRARADIDAHQRRLVTRILASKLYPNWTSHRGNAETAANEQYIALKMAGVLK